MFLPQCCQGPTVRDSPSRFRGKEVSGQLSDLPTRYLLRPRSSLTKTVLAHEFAETRWNGSCRLQGRQYERSVRYPDLRVKRAQTVLCTARLTKSERANRKPGRGPELVDRPNDSCSKQFSSQPKCLPLRVLIRRCLLHYSPALAAGGPQLLSSLE